MARPQIDGLYELGHVLYALDADAHGFVRDDIERIECFWTFSDMHASSAGFVMTLRNGRRVYVDLQHWHAFEQNEDFRIEAEFLANGQVRPDLEASCRPPGGWSSDVAHLNRMLAD